MKEQARLSIIVISVTAAVNFYAAAPARAAITFIDLTVDAKGEATVGAIGTPLSKLGGKVVTATDVASTTDLATAIATGVASAPAGVSKSYGAANAKVSASLVSASVSAKAADAADVTFSFSGAARASTGLGASAAAYAKAGDSGSSGVYAFASTTATTLTIAAETTSLRDAAAAYVVDLYNLTRSVDFASFGVAANDDLSWSYAIPAGSWRVSILEATGANAADSVDVSGKGQSAFGASVGTFEVSATVPEASTWGMLGLGFAGLAFAGRRSRQAISPF